MELGRSPGTEWSVHPALEAIQDDAIGAALTTNEIPEGRGSTGRWLFFWTIGWGLRTMRDYSRIVVQVSVA